MGTGKSPKRKTCFLWSKYQKKSSLERQTILRQYSLYSSPSSIPISEGQVESLDLYPPQTVMRHLPSPLEWCQKRGFQDFHH